MCFVGELEMQKTKIRKLKKFQAEILKMFKKQVKKWTPNLIYFLAFYI
jgi:hypothetical protein